MALRLWVIEDAAGFHVQTKEAEGAVEVPLSEEDEATLAAVPSLEALMPILSKCVLAGCCVVGHKMEEILVKHGIVQKK